MKNKGSLVVHLTKGDMKMGQISLSPFTISTQVYNHPYNFLKFLHNFDLFIDWCLDPMCDRRVKGRS